MKSKRVKTKTSYIKLKKKKFIVTISFDVNAKDKEEVESIVGSLGKVIAKKYNSNVGFYFTEMG